MSKVPRYSLESKNGGLNGPSLLEGRRRFQPQSLQYDYDQLLRSNAISLCHGRWLSGLGGDALHGCRAV